MSTSRSIRCLFARPSAHPRPCPRRQFHSTPSHHARPTPKHISLKASEMGLSKSSPPKPANYLPYTSAEKAALSKRYTPAQVAAIEAGESSIDPNDLSTQATLRRDPMTLPYLDDFATIRSVIDHPIRAPESNYDPHLRYKTEDELASDLASWIENLPDDADRVEWMKFTDTVRLTVGKEEAELNPRSSLAPRLQQPLADPSIRYEADAEDGEEAEPHMKRLMLATGYSRDVIRRFRTKVLVSKRVANTTRMGKISSMYFLTVAGNGRGLLGIGEGKADEPEAAREQATMAAIRNLVPIPRYEGRTIFGDVKGKVGAVELELFHRPPGGWCFFLSLSLSLSLSSLCVDSG